MLIAAALGALLGAQTGYVIGRRVGPALLGRTRNQHLLRGAARAEALLGRYGHGKAVFLARFIPLVRTVLNPLAGVVQMRADVRIRRRSPAGSPTHDDAVALPDPSTSLERESNRR
ncbi:VTT domain-containing protein [Microbispora sp. NBC_01189]|uniref:DedA family protein n=1 Tax=Microbispora sp. NBC_01189 TaxID=2903583 RepID=UPI002E0FF870|nr:VTT domain-containing protein [Microbispora sp. NBC_01189]